MPRWRRIASLAAEIPILLFSSSSLPAFLRRPAVVMACGALILTLAMGVRHTGGLFLQPMTLDHGWSRELFSFSIALQNLLWGVFQPFAGAFADRHGAGRTLVGGALLYILGLVIMAHADSALGLNLGAGLLIGMGLSGTTFSVVLGVIGRMAAPEKRSLALGIASAGTQRRRASCPGSETRSWPSALAPRTRSATCGRDLTAATLPLPEAASYPGLRLTGRQRRSGAWRSASAKWTVAHRSPPTEDDLPRLGGRPDRYTGGHRERVIRGQMEAATRRLECPGQRR